MKKFLLLIFCLSLLTACASNPNTSSDGSNTDMNVERMFAQTFAAVEDMNSFHTEIDFSQDISFPVDGTSRQQNIQTNTAADVHTQPNRAMYLEQTFQIPEVQEESTTETYITPEGFFTYDPIQHTWLTTSEEQAMERSNIYEEQMFASAQIDDIRTVLSQEGWTVQKNDTDWVLSYNEPTEQAKKYIVNHLNPNFVLSGGHSAGVSYQQLDLQNFTLNINIDRDTLVPSTITTSFEMTSTAEGSATEQLSQAIKITYSNWNEAKQVQLPESVQESAQMVSLSVIP
ncbi:hypothetical protein G4V62_04435 [Bacillaceae bacterium SIJ1]|uniref:DUF6612 family protein n=1 Tax=Litoribacterium kuwaitense TaxID=1398745 RepID=UPI0013EAF288|nr:DUF6612 family protein [Litoribacterium kuwaitense]NGP44233.1 hypothetical protein [Litoribacterium kuwaitense]